MIIRKKKGLLVIPKEMLSKINGNKRRRIEMVITDPRSRHIILTRQSDLLKTWYSITIERGLDFIPSTTLKKAKINSSTNYEIVEADGNLVIRTSGVTGSANSVQKNRKEKLDEKIKNFLKRGRGKAQAIQPTRRKSL